MSSACVSNGYLPKGIHFCEKYSIFHTAFSFTSNNFVTRLRLLLTLTCYGVHNVQAEEKSTKGLPVRSGASTTCTCQLSSPTTMRSVTT